MNDTATYTTKGKPFERDMSYLPDRVLAGERSADPLDDQFPSGSKDSPRDVPVWDAEPGRYRLVAARACPWAHRSIIVRTLLGLEDVISWGAPGPTHDARSWTFDLDEGGRDPVLGIERLQEAYFAREPDYPRGITVPAIVEVESGKVVTNDFPQITHDLSFEWREHQRPDAPDLWPADLREEMEAVMKRVFTEVNNGVYRCGFAGSQEAYEDAYDRLFTTLDWLEERLADRRYLMGDAAHRGRRPAVHHAGALRRGLPRALQVQPQQADRDAEPLGLRPRPLPDAGLRRRGGLRPDQEALLRRPHRHQPDADRPGGPDESGWRTPHGRG